MNPWKKILLSDYENHMSLESVAQLQALNRIMKEQFCIYEMLRKKTDINEELHGNVMILGVAGGNGLEHVTPKYYEKIYGVDINAEYLEAVKTRYTNLSGILDCLEVDLITEYEKLPKSDYVIADLLVEYIGYKAFQRVIRQVDPEMISCVIQMNPKTVENENSEWVSDSPYLHAFDGLDEVHQQMEEDALWRCLKELGYDEVDAFNTPLPNGKYLLRIDFAKSMERYISGYRSKGKNYMSELIIKHDELTAEEFIYMWESVWGEGPSLEQTKLAMAHTLFRVSIFDGERIVGMARVIGDMGLCYYIKDVIVRPEYQGKGIGRMLIDELLAFINHHGVQGTHIFVELCAMPDKIPFYEKFGFSANEAQRLRIMYHVD